MKSRFLFKGRKSPILDTVIVATSILLAAQSVIANQITQTENFTLSGAGRAETIIKQNEVLQFNQFNGIVGDLIEVTVRLDSKYNTNLFAQVFSDTSGGVSIQAENDVNYAATFSRGPLFSLDPSPLTAECVIDNTSSFCFNEQESGDVEFNNIYQVLGSSVDGFIGTGQFLITVEELATYNATVNGTDNYIDASIFIAGWSGSIAVEYEFTPAQELNPIPEPSNLPIFALGLAFIIFAWLRRLITPATRKSPADR